MSQLIRAHNESKRFLIINGINYPASLDHSTPDDKRKTQPQSKTNPTISDAPPLVNCQIDQSAPNTLYRKRFNDFSINSLKSNDSGQHSMSENLEYSKTIGQGGFGKIWLVESDNPSDKFAFKVPFNPKSLPIELEKMDLAGHHPNIIKAFGIADIGGKQGILMEYIPGEDLSLLLPKMTQHYLDGTLSHSEFWGTVQFILKEILTGIRHLEKRGCAHQDIKPHNIRVHNDSLIPIIMDFGNLGIFGQAGEIGTELYSPSELLASHENTKITDKFDTYAVGQIIYSLFSSIVNPGVVSFFTAGAKYDDLHACERHMLIIRLHLAMKKYQKIELSGKYQTALTPISQKELETELKVNLQQTFKDIDKITITLEREYSKFDNTNISLEEIPLETMIEKAYTRFKKKKKALFEIPLDMMLENELPKILTRENMVGHYRSGYQSSLVKFINSTLHPNPDSRLNAKEALQHEFISDPLLEDKPAKKVIRKVFEIRGKESPKS